jgi:hypothetical protein
MIFKMDDDPETFTLAEFIEANSDPDVEPLLRSDVVALCRLNVGDEYAIACGGGYTLITRVR